MTSYFAHPTALVESENIGEGTLIWAFAHIMAGATVGKKCLISDHTFIETGAIIGNNVTVKNGVSVWNKVTIKDDVFIGPNVAFTNDLRPRRKLKWEPVETIVERGVGIGANATIVGGITIGEFAMIGAGAVVTRDVPPYALVYGNPARIHGNVCRCGSKLRFEGVQATCSSCGRKYTEEQGQIIFVGDER